MTGVLMFAAFALISVLICYYCVIVIRRNRKKLASPGLSKWDRAHATFNIVVMLVPLVGFGFEALFFSWKLLSELARGLPR